MPKTKSRRNGETSSSATSTSRHSPASNLDVVVVPSYLPAPSTTTTTRMTRSITSSTARPSTNNHSRSASIVSGYSRTIGDSDLTVTQEKLVYRTTSSSSSPRESNRRRQFRKSPRSEVVVVPSAGGGAISESNSNVVVPRFGWRKSEDEDEDDENMGRLDDNSDMEVVVEVEEGMSGCRDSAAIQAQASTHVDLERSEAGPSTSHRAPSPPPLTTLSSTHDGLVDIDHISPFSTISSSLGMSSLRTRHAPLHETPASPVSSPSLMKIINQTNISPGIIPSKRKRESPPPLVDDDLEIIEISNLPPSKDKGKGKGKGKAKAISLSPTPSPPPPPPPSAIPPTTTTELLTKPEPEPLSEYTCPICFFPPSNATLTPCGHVCCGSCLFMAVKTTLQRGASMGMPMNVGENLPRCPVCRAVIPGWDGKGGGVIGLKVKVLE